MFKSVKALEKYSSLVSWLKSHLNPKIIKLNNDTRNIIINRHFGMFSIYIIIYEKVFIKSTAYESLVYKNTYMKLHITTD